MKTIHVVEGVGVAPTEMASYDAALADANVHNYNLVRVSSVIPADATVTRVARAPDLGPAGNRLIVVEARATAAPGGSDVAAGLAWATGSGPGIFYEASGVDPESVRAEVREGVRAGGKLREWELPTLEETVVHAEAAPDAYTTVVALAAYGDSEPVF